MFRKVLAIIALAGTTYAHAQDSTSAPLSISGSVDAYYKYDFSKYRNADGGSNIGTYFADEQNSLSLGMIDIALSKTTGKASFVGEVSFGPRGQASEILSGSIPTGKSGESFHIQNLYATYAFTDKFSMTAGYMGTFIGYEVISPVANFNYSTSYLFSSGPFQNAGIKANYAVSSKVGLMVGLFNDWNVYQDFNGLSHFGAQLSLTPTESLSAYLNLMTGSSAGGEENYSSGTIVDLTATYQATEKFALGLNTADYSFQSDGGYTGVALYPKYSLSDSFGLGLRGEYFKWKDVDGEDGTAYTALTLSANLKSGGLTFIPEVRFDGASNEVFSKKNLAPTKSASQFSLAVVYAF